MAPEQRAAARGGLQQWRLPVELWQVPGGRSARTEGGCGWHPSDSLAVIPEDIPCRCATEYRSLMELWQQSNHMQVMQGALWEMLASEGDHCFVVCRAKQPMQISCDYSLAFKVFCCACRASNIAGMASQGESPCSSSPQYSRLHHL